MLSILLIKLLLFIHVNNNDETICRVIVGAIGGVFGAVGGLFLVAAIVLIVCGIQR